jgi:GH18 family chitinase
LYNKESRVWITYDDEMSYKYKAEYVVDNSLGGMFMWELDGDKDHVIWNTIDKVFTKAENKDAGKRALYDSSNYFLYLM